MTDLEQKLVEFAKWVLRDHREYMGGLDGASIQEKAEELDLLIKKTINEPCGPNCVCAEVGDPPYTCLFLCEGLTL